MATSQLLISHPHNHGSAIDRSHRGRATTRRAWLRDLRPDPGINLNRLATEESLFAVEIPRFAGDRQIGEYGEQFYEELLTHQGNKAECY